MITKLPTLQLQIILSFQLQPYLLTQLSSIARKLKKKFLTYSVRSLKSQIQGDL
eukprot:UN21366